RLWLRHVTSLLPAADRRASARRPVSNRPRAVRARGVTAEGPAASGKDREQPLARLPAAPADLRADAAVRVVVGMPPALLGTGGARSRAGRQQGADHAEVGRRLPDDDAPRGVARVGAVQAVADAGGQLLGLVLAQAGVRARAAARGAVEALLDAPQQRVAIDVRRVGMEGD